MSKKENITLENADDFLKILYDVASKLANLMKTQSPRFVHLWEEYISKINPNPHIPRLIPFDKEKFLNDDEYKATTLRITEGAIVDLFYAIKSIADAIFTQYFRDSELFLSDFSEEDRKILPYLCAVELHGKLLEFLMLEHKNIPLKYIILGKNHQMLNIKGITLAEALNSLKKSEIEIEISDLKRVLDELEQEGIIQGSGEGDEREYTMKIALELTPEGNAKYKEFIYPLLNWSVLNWRSFYNIRELNVTPPDDYKWLSYLTKVLPRAATQGFRAAHYVIKNLAKYYEMVSEEEKKE
jgi:hypothetical protein